MSSQTKPKSTTTPSKFGEGISSDIFRDEICETYFDRDISFFGLGKTMITLEKCQTTS